MVRYKKENVQVRQWKKKGQKRTLYVGDGQRVKNKMYYFTLDVTKNNIADCLLCLKTHKTDLCVKKCLTKLDCWNMVLILIGFWLCGTDWKCSFSSLTHTAGHDEDTYIRGNSDNCQRGETLLIWCGCVGLCGVDAQWRYIKIHTHDKHGSEQQVLQPVKAGRESVITECWNKRIQSFCVSGHYQDWTVEQLIT